MGKLKATFAPRRCVDCHPGFELVNKLLMIIIHDDDGINGKGSYVLNYYFAIKHICEIHNCQNSGEVNYMG